VTFLFDWVRAGHSCCGGSHRLWVPRYEQMEIFDGPSRFDVRVAPLAGPPYLDKVVSVRALKDEDEDESISDSKLPF